MAKPRLQPTATAGGRYRTEVGVAAPEAHRVLTLPQKAALIISALGPKDAEPILTRLGEDEVRHFARAASELGQVSASLLEETVHEFQASLETKNVNVNSDRLKEILSSIMSADAIERILEDMDESDGRSIWEKLSNSDPVDLANFLSREHPQTVAVVLSRIRPDASAKIMARLETDFAEEVVMRLSKVSLLSSSVMDAVKDTIEGDFLRGARLKKSKRKPDELIGSIFNFMPGESRDALMSGLEQNAPALAVAVQRKMFTFLDIPKRVDRASITVILREVEKDVLITALSAARKNAPESKEFFLGNMSRRLAEQYADQIEDSQTPNAREGEEAQFEVVGVIRKLAERGEISLNQPEEDEGEDDY